MNRLTLSLMAGLAACSPDLQDTADDFEITDTASDSGAAEVYEDLEAQACLASVIEQGRNDTGAMLLIGPNSHIDGIIQARSGPEDLAYDDLRLITTEEGDANTARFAEMNWTERDGVNLIKFRLSSEGPQEMTGHINDCQGTSAWTMCGDFPRLHNDLNGCEPIGEVWTF